MTSYMSLHNVAEIKIEEVERHERKHTGEFFIRHIVIKDAKGEKFELSLFSDEEGGLNLNKGA